MNRSVDTHAAFRALVDLDNEGIPAGLAIQVASVVFTSLTPASRQILIDAIVEGTDAEWRVLTAHVNHGVMAGRAAVERRRRHQAEGRL